MLEVKEKVKLKISLFDTNIEEYFNTELRDTMGDDDYKYNLILHIHPSEITKKNVNSFESSIKREWFSTFSWNEKVENVIRMATSKIIQYVEDHYFLIHQVFVSCKQGLENEIMLEKNNVFWEATRKEKAKRIYLDILLEDKTSIHKIVDSILFREEDFLIDERNNDRKLFNSLLFRKERKQNLDYKNLTEENWKQLVLKEKVTTKELAELYDVKETVITKQRKLFISNQKEYYDEYVFYEVMLYHMTGFDYFSNFSIPLLEQMKLKNIKVVYEYANATYHELFHVEEELKRQKEIEKNNLAGKEYVVPLSGILLKKFYMAVKDKMVDRKILKNNYFATYYNKDILLSFMKNVEESHILEQYETGKIYKSPHFKTYQELYKMLHLELEEEESNTSDLQLMPAMESKAHIIKNRDKKRIIVPKDYVKLAKSKKKVGDIGQELVFDYEWEQLKEYPELQKRIEKTYLTNDAAGYDIKSFDYDGKEIYIEVKTSKISGEDRIHFLISDTEDKFITENKNAYIYYVYDLDVPKLRIIDQEMYLGYKKNVKQYEINQDVI